MEQQEIFSEIYDRHIDKVYRFIFLRVNSQETAQDLCSETFLRAWKIFRENPNKIKNHQAFLYRVARNLVIDYYRKKGRTEIISADNVSVIDPNSELENKSLLDSDLKQVRAALSSIKNDYQEVIIWRYIEDLSISEIAKILGK